MKIVTDLRRARRLRANPDEVPELKRQAHRKHRRWSKIKCHLAQIVGDGDFHRAPFLTSQNVI